MNIFQRLDQCVHKKVGEWLDLFFPSKNNSKRIHVEKLAMITSFLAKLIDELVGAFLEIKGESREDAARKITLNFIGRFIYGVTDWVVAFGLGALSFWVQFRKDIFFTEESIFAVIFLYDFLWASIFFWTSHKSKMDFTWGEAYKRVMDVLWKYGPWGKIFSALYGVYISVKAIAWEGPEVICCAYQKQLKTRSNVWVALYLLSAIQGFCGYWLYKTTYGLALRYDVDFSSGVKVAAFGIMASIAILGVFFVIGRMLNLLTLFLHNANINPIVRVSVFFSSLLFIFGFMICIAYKGLAG